MAPEGARNLPVVIYTHGLRQDKASGTELACRLAGQGIATVSIDARMHGDRPDERLTNAYDPTRNVFPPESGIDIGLAYNRCIVETARDIDRLIDALAGDARIDADRIGISGFSMGGVIAYSVAAHNPTIRAVAPIGAVPSQLTRWRDILFETSTQPEWRAAIDEHADLLAAVEELLRADDASGDLLAFAPKPLMMVNGDIDTAQPKHYALELAKRLRPLYREHPENLRVFLPPVEHRMTAGIIKEVCAWFAGHL